MIEDRRTRVPADMLAAPVPDRGTVTSPQTGRPILCCWAECDKPGRAEYSVRVIEAQSKIFGVHKRTIYLFCSNRHRELYAFGHQAYGQLPPGMATVDGHTTVPAQPWKGTT